MRLATEQENVYSLHLMRALEKNMSPRKTQAL